MFTDVTVQQLSTVAWISLYLGLYCWGQPNRSPFFMRISVEDLKELTELIEDTVEYYCDDKMMSGEKVWTVIECLATAKLQLLEAEQV